jgi:hypothetical protein
MTGITYAELGCATPQTTAYPQAVCWRSKFFESLLGELNNSVRRVSTRLSRSTALNWLLG